MIWGGWDGAKWLDPGPFVFSCGDRDDFLCHAAFDKLSLLTGLVAQPAEAGTEATAAYHFGFSQGGFEGIHRDSVANQSRHPLGAVEESDESRGGPASTGSLGKPDAESSSQSRLDYLVAVVDSPEPLGFWFVRKSDGLRGSGRPDNEIVDGLVT